MPSCKLQCCWNCRYSSSKSTLSRVGVATIESSNNTKQVPQQMLRCLTFERFPSPLHSLAMLVLKMMVQVVFCQASGCSWHCLQQFLRIHRTESSVIASFKLESFQCGTHLTNELWACHCPIGDTLNDHRLVVWIQALLLKKCRIREHVDGIHDVRCIEIQHCPDDHSTHISLGEGVWVIDCKCKFCHQICCEGHGNAAVGEPLGNPSNLGDVLGAYQL